MLTLLMSNADNVTMTTRELIWTVLILVLWPIPALLSMVYLMLKPPRCVRRVRQVDTEIHCDPEL